MVRVTPDASVVETMTVEADLVLFRAIVNNSAHVLRGHLSPAREIWSKK